MRRSRTGRRSRRRSTKRRTMKRRRTRAPRRTGGWRMPTHELKYLDYDISAQNAGTGLQLGQAASQSIISSTPAKILLNGLVQGSDATQRVGRQIVIKKFIARLTFVMPTVDPATKPTWPSFVRVMLVYDMQTNATAFTLTDLFNDSTDFAALQNLNNRDRFKVIKDKVYSLNKSAQFTTDASDMGACRFVKIYKRLNLPTTYNANSTGNVGDIQTGSLYLLVFANGCNNSATAGDQIHMHGYCRIRYADC